MSHEDRLPSRRETVTTARHRKTIITPPSTRAARYLVGAGLSGCRPLDAGALPTELPPSAPSTPSSPPAAASAAPASLSLPGMPPGDDDAGGGGGASPSSARRGAPGGGGGEGDAAGEYDGYGELPPDDLDGSKGAAVYDDDAPPEFDGDFDGTSDSDGSDDNDDDDGESASSDNDDGAAAAGRDADDDDGLDGLDGADATTTHVNVVGVGATPRHLGPALRAVAARRELDEVGSTFDEKLQRARLNRASHQELSRISPRSSREL